MCGLVGMAGAIFQNERRMFRDMLIFDTVRGIDSTGVFGLNREATSVYKENGLGKDGKPIKVYSHSEYSWVEWLEKTVGTPGNLWEYGNSENFTDEGYVRHWDCKLLIGHNRAATIGKITDDMAHPHTAGKITGVHNGTIPGYKRIFGDKYDSDSIALFNHIDEHGIADTWKILEGAAALVWWDRSEGTLNLLRNDQRPLYLAENIQMDTLFWASEPWMLTVSALRAGIKLREIKENEGNKFWQLPVNTLNSFSFNGSKLERQEPVQLEAYTRPPVKQIGFLPRQDQQGKNIDEKGLFDCECCSMSTPTAEMDEEVWDKFWIKMCGECAASPFVRRNLTEIARYN